VRHTVRKKKHSTDIQQLSLSFHAELAKVFAAGPVQSSTTPTEQDNHELESNTDAGAAPVVVTEYNREKALARLMQIGDELGINDDYWKTLWNRDSDEQIQISLPKWEQYCESVMRGRRKES